MRQIFAVNNQFPGPLIEANEGDEVVIHMNNNLDIGMAVHWHGLYQNGTAFMDGVPGVSQVSRFGEAVRCLRAENCL